MSLLGTVGKAVGGDLVSGGLSLLGGWLQSRAAKNAAAEQRKAGEAAAGRLEAQAMTSAGRISDAGTAAAHGLENAGGAAQAGVGEAGRLGQERIDTALTRFDPYSHAGTDALSRLQAGIAPGGEFSGQFTGDINGFTNDAGLKYRLTQGVDQIQNTAAAKGLVGGNTVKALETYRQDQASQEAGAAFQRAQSTFQMNRDNTLNPLTALVGVGERANTSILGGNTNAANMGLDTAQTVGDIGMRTATGAGGFRVGATSDAENLATRAAEAAAGYRTGAAASGAAGIIGSGNAWADALTNVAKSVDFGELTRRRKGLGVEPGRTDPLPTIRSVRRAA